MPNPYVTNVAFIKKQIVLTIAVDDFVPRETLEISGYATQAGGGFAVFDAIQSVPEPNPDGKIYMYVTAPPSGDFTKGHAVTVVLRAARVWTTVLGAPEGAGVTPRHEDEPAEEGAAWNDIKAVKYAGPSSTGYAGHTPTGGEASFLGA